MKDQVESSWQKILTCLRERGLAFDAPATPAEIAAAARARFGTTLVAEFVDGCYYPALYGRSDAAVDEGKMADIIRRLQSELARSAPAAAPANAAPPELAPAVGQGGDAVDLPAGAGVRPAEQVIDNLAPLFQLPTKALPESFTPVHPAVINHVVKAVLGFAAFAGPMIGATTGEKNRAALMLFLFFIPGWFFLSWAVRNVIALFRRPALVLVREEIFIRWWKAPGFITTLIPYYRMQEMTIPLAEFAGCSTYTRSVNSIPVEQTVIIKGSRGTAVIARDHFRESVGRIQVAVLDFYELKVRQPHRRAARIPEFLSLRYREAHDLSIPGKLGLHLLGAAVGAGVCAGLLGSHYRDDHPNIAGWGALIAGAVCIASIWDLFQVRRAQFLRLEQLGVRVGASENASRLIRWEDLLFVRARVTDKRLTALDLRLSDGSSFVIPASGRTRPQLDALQAWLAPDPGLVREAHARIAGGAAAEAAAVAVGLPARS